MLKWTERKNKSCIPYNTKLELADNSWKQNYLKQAGAEQMNWAVKVKQPKGIEGCEQSPIFNNK